MTAAARLPTSSRRRGGWGDAMTGERSRGCSGRRRPDPASVGPDPVPTRLDRASQPVATGRRRTLNEERGRGGGSGDVRGGRRSRAGR
ncbi:Os03g0349600 [Oryza sativa Japonica Group]|uniref:Os03g0349600 protein n=1 Tax=Oryza sativa subsp. japonica TaxID=39947 RepID=A0A0P0VXD6_ORYSJ|nr:hypothetical protein EE612_017405 [Oryza sativa]BAS84190.1 Os03g0349600 [Oryza sativa Japonica Group]